MRLLLDENLPKLFMITSKKHFFLKLNPPRSSFPLDMTAEERSIMQKHVAYWAPYVDNGNVIVLGRDMDPKGGGGGAGLALDAEDQLRTLVDHYPATG